jgi:hypothetical protein
LADLSKLKSLRQRSKGNTVQVVALKLVELWTAFMTALHPCSPYTAWASLSLPFIHDLLGLGGCSSLPEDLLISIMAAYSNCFWYSPMNSCTISKIPPRLEAAAKWQKENLMGFVRGLSVSPIYNFTGSPSPGQYLGVTLKVLAAHYHQLQLGKSAVCGGIEVPADHQHLPALQVDGSAGTCSWESLLQLLISGLLTHYVIIPADQFHSIAQLMRELVGLEMRADGVADALGAMPSTGTQSSGSSSAGNTSSGIELTPSGGRAGGASLCVPIRRSRRRHGSRSHQNKPMELPAVVGGPALIPWLLLHYPANSKTSLAKSHPKDGGLVLIKAVLELLLLLWPSSQVRRVLVGGFISEDSSGPAGKG